MLTPLEKINNFTLDEETDKQIKEKEAEIADLKIKIKKGEVFIKSMEYSKSDRKFQEMCNNRLATYKKQIVVNQNIINMLGN